MNLDVTILVISSLGGILPALLWLWFWLREDKLHPEPRKRLMLCFIAGMAIVVLVYPLQKAVYANLGLAAMTIIAWAAIEEIAKYLAALISAFRSKDFDEPIDGLIYMITAALGFSALENTLFILDPLIKGDIIHSIATGNMRFIGASLLHVASSAAIGFAVARTFFMPFWKKFWWRIIGIIVAITLHSVFNFFIIQGNGTNTLLAFSLIWAFIILVLFLFEKIKKLKK